MDPISNMLVQLKNAVMAGKNFAVVPHSNLKMEIAKVLLKHGYLSNVTKRGKKIKKFLYCEIAPTPAGRRLAELKRISKPSRRVYFPVKEIHFSRDGSNVTVFSTPKGILLDKEAHEAKVGGEALFKIG